LRSQSKEQLISFYKEIIPILKEKVGSHKTYNPMYPNFPMQVMKATKCELYLNAIVHYVGDWIGQRIVPEYNKEERFPMIENFDLELIDLGTKTEFYEIFINLMSSKTSISDFDKQNLYWYITKNKEIIVLPKEIPHKEILSTISEIIIKDTNLSPDLITKYYETATDVLRLATAMSYGDVSLANNTKFSSFKRKTRRFLIALLEKIAKNNPNFIEDLNLHRGKWVRLAYGLHISEFKEKFPKTHQAISIIRSNDSIYTTNTHIEQFLKDKNIQPLVKILKDRGGIFARRLDHILRISNKNKMDLVIKSFEETVKTISTPVLLQLISHFSDRNNEEKKFRVFFPKGNLAKGQIIKNNLPKINQKVCDTIIEICRKTLIEKFSQLEELGKVYIDESLRNYNVPFSQRSASKSLKTIVRGSRIKIPEGSTLRFFLWWTDGESRTDIDLSSIILDKDYRYIQHISYTELRSQTLESFHSGDITSAPEGACEFIDLNIDSILANKGKYIVMNIHSFTSQKFSELECFAGWMVRKECNSGEIFEPKSVQDRLDLSSESTICIPLMFDLEKREMIWGDLALNKNPSHENNLENNLSSLSLMAISLDQMVKPNLYELFSLHIKARKGIIVENRKEADIIFSLDQGITPFQFDTISSQYL
jgi:hypothetical protein